MTVECLLARPATGKTAYCVQRARERAVEIPFAKIWVITPGSFQSRYFRRRLAEDGGIFGVTVGTFENFAQKILEREKATLPIAPISLTTAMIENLLERRRNANRLTHYQSIENFPGFVKVLREVFSELILSNIDPKEYTNKAETPEERELGELYTEFRAETERLGWDSKAGMVARAATRLRANSKLGLDVSLILVDGFDEFTEVELDLLNAFDSIGLEMLVTLPTEEGSHRPAHTKALVTLRKLRESFVVSTISLAGTPRLPVETAGIEEALFERSAPYPVPEAERKRLPILLECRSPEAEAREALRWIKSLVAREGVPISECAIFASDDTAYENVVRPIANEFGLSIFYFHRKKFSDIPAGAALLRALRLPTVNFASEHLFSVIHSPYFAYKNLDARVHYLEETARFGKVLRGKDQWEEAWNALKEGYQHGFPDWLRYRAEIKLPPEEEIDTLRSELSELMNLFPPAEEERSFLAWARWLDETLEKLGFYEQTDSEEERMIREVLEDSFRTIQLGDTLYGARSIPYQRFAEILNLNIAISSVDDPNESNENAVFFGSLVEARAVRYQAVCLLGMAEGAFPRRQREDPFLREELRSRLGMSSRLRADQVSVYYQAVTRADKYLLITRPTMTEKGDTKHASPYWEETINCFPQGHVRRISGEDPLDPSLIASNAEALFYFAGAGEISLGGFAAQHGAEIVKARKRYENFNEYNGVLPILSPALSEQFNKNQVWSSSAVESFGKCAFTFFINKTLGIDEIEEVEEELGVNHIGTMNHAILERLFREHPNERDFDALVVHLRVIAAEVFETAPKRFNFRPTNLWSLTKQQILNNLIDTVEKLLVTFEKWTPMAFEFAFGKLENPPLKIDLEKETILFRGFIDRIDQNIEGDLLVLDYKLGTGFTGKDFYNGRIIQFMIYALAAQAHFNRKVLASLYWSVNQKRTFGPKWEGDVESKKVQEQLEVLRALLEKFLIDIRTGQFPPIPSSEKCSPYCPVITWCWQANPEKMGY